MTMRLNLCFFPTKRTLITARVLQPASCQSASRLPSEVCHALDDAVHAGKPAEVWQGNTILLDATFGTNSMKMPLYTGLIIDSFGNSVPGFMNLCQGTSQVDISLWLAALLDKIRQKDPDWMCSCIMVDDAIAEINAIRQVRIALLYHQ